MTERPDICDLLTAYITEANIDGGDATRVARWVLVEAKAEIERLRSIVGAARIDPGFREITGALSRRSSEPQSPKVDG